VKLHATDQKVKNGLAHWSISSVQRYSSLSYDGVRADINTYSRPIHAGWSWTAGGGHAVLIDGYCTDTVNYVDYMDPADGSSYFTTYVWLVGGTGYNHTWDGTLKNIHD
jgi:hypothetical protein